MKTTNAKNCIYAIIYFLIFIAVLFLCFGCVTQKKCAAKFPPQTVTIRNDSVIEKTVYRDTTIFIKLPVETVTKFDTIYVTKSGLFVKPVTAETNYAFARSWIAYNKLNLTLTDKDTTLIVTLNDAIKSRDFWVSKYASDRLTVIVPLRTKFQKFLLWYGIVSWIAIAGYLALKIRKFIV